MEYYSFVDIVMNQNRIIAFNNLKLYFKNKECNYINKK